MRVVMLVSQQTARPTVLAGRQLPAREVAMHVLSAGWVDVTRCVEAVAIVFAESLAYTEAVGPTDDYGIWQIHWPSHRKQWEANGGDFESFKRMAFSPAEATKFARRLFVENGSKWSTTWYAYTNGSYKRFLRKAVFGVFNAVAQRFGLEPVPMLKNEPS